MTPKRLVELIDLAGYEARSYSGRGMFGSYCVGVTCDDVTDFIADLMLVAKQGERGYLRTSYNTDSMGKSMIVYWPNVASQEGF